MTARRSLLASLLVFLLALIATAPTVADFGYTYDEPAYRYSQVLSGQWWERLAKARDRAAFSELLDRDSLLYYWPYGRHGINFHPPLGGQLNLLTHAVFGPFLKDIPSRRMAPVIEFSLTAALLFGFLARRYGPWVGGVAACSLVLMPRLYGQAHLIDTDIPGLMIWTMASFSFWKGLTEPHARIWRVLVGILLGLAFVEKMGAVLVVLPILGWMTLGPLLRSIARRDRAAWTDGVVTAGAQLIPLGIAYLEIRRLSVAYLTLQSRIGVRSGQLTPARTDLFRDHPETWMPGAFLLLPLLVWIVRRVVARLRSASPVWGAERPALEILTAILAFAPAVGWLGNPAWWRETLPRLAHYYAISTARRGVLPDIQILFFGQNYEFSLPWYNAWVLIAITVPASILIASCVGLIAAPWRDRLPVFFLLNLATLPAMRMLETPAHDGVRLFLPTFLYLAAFAGWGVVGLASRSRRWWLTPILAALTLLPAAWSLVRVHPYELSYYNAFIGGPRGAWDAGFELSYWYDAFTDDEIERINRVLPPGSRVSFANEKSTPIMVLEDQQSLGILRGDVEITMNVEDGPTFPHVWLLTHDSKASAFTRLLYAMRPLYTVRPRQLDGVRVVTIDDPVAVSRAWALQLMLDRDDTAPPDPPRAPLWVRDNVPRLARLWGDGLKKSPRLGVEESAFSWARADPDGLRAAARLIAARGAVETSEPARRLLALINRYPARAAMLLRARPEALPEAVEILIARPEALRRLLLRYPYTDPQSIGGELDQKL